MQTFSSLGLARTEGAREERQRVLAYLKKHSLYLHDLGERCKSGSETRAQTLYAGGYLDALWDSITHGAHEQEEFSVPTLAEGEQAMLCCLCSHVSTHTYNGLRFCWFCYSNVVAGNIKVKPVKDSKEVD